MTHGSATMTVTQFTSSPTTPGSLVSGSQVVSVGATLQVGNGQVPGNYIGSFEVTINYE